MTASSDSRPERFLDLESVGPEAAEVIVLPAPFEGTVSYGGGTSAGPRAIVAASCQIELWDEELDFDLDSVAFHVAPPVESGGGDTPESFTERLFQRARQLRPYGALILALGGEHSITPPLVRAAADDAEDLSGVTVVQFDAHSDLREEYEGTRCSHASAMRRVLERGATIIAVGIRSADREEFDYGRRTGRVHTYFAQRLAEDADHQRQLFKRLHALAGDVYLTIDVDALEVMFCPGTGTPQPGGLGWWQVLRYLRALLYENRARRLIGCDIVETAPMQGTRVNEFTAARLAAKVIAYATAPQPDATAH